MGVPGDSSGLYPGVRNRGMSWIPPVVYHKDVFWRAARATGGFDSFRWLLCAARCEGSPD